MTLYVGLDVSQRETEICVVDEDGRRVLAYHQDSKLYVSPTSPTYFAPSLSDLPCVGHVHLFKAKRKPDYWAPELRAEFLTDPFKFASGTNVRHQGRSRKSVHRLRTV